MRVSPALAAKRGIHTRPNNGISNDWLTPPGLLKKLGPFHLDPCAHPGQFYKTAAKMVAPPDDGLAIDWGTGRVWLNPPYGSQLAEWLNRLAMHGRGTALVPSRTEVERWFWPFIWEAATAIMFLRGRLYFLRPDGTEQGNAGHGSVLVAYGKHDADVLKSSGIDGRFFMLRGAPCE